MAKHTIGTRAEWRAARIELLAAEKELTRKGDELARRRQELPWVRIDKEYRLETDEGSVTLPDLFRGRSQLLVYHFMFGPDYEAGCPSCSGADDSTAPPHLANHDVMLRAVSRAPFAKLQAYKRWMGGRSGVRVRRRLQLRFRGSVSEEQQRRERRIQLPTEHPRQGAMLTTGACRRARGDVRTDVPTYVRERPGVSAFVLEDGVVYHTYSAFARGLDALWGMFQWLDRAPKGRNESETSTWWRRHDEYE
jgi:predicted dithiol-disulfide oxidoreductase (DUF899 family)